MAPLWVQLCFEVQIRIGNKTCEEKMQVNNRKIICGCNRAGMNGICCVIVSDGPAALPDRFFKRPFLCR
jgi:hypothetical protein